MPLTYALVGALYVVAALAHMQLHYPPPFNASNNRHRTSLEDPYLQYPYDCCGPNARWENPCRGYLSLLGTPQGAPTASWEVGSPQAWNISGIGNHYGGSCQVGFSTDKGETFRVAASYEGNCPHRRSGDGPEGQDFQFIVPDDLEPGVQVFAWIWHNREQEFNMNCAAVNITERTGPKPDRPLPETSSPCSHALESSVLSPASAQTTTTTTVYETEDDCLCTCEDPSKLETCVCDCPKDQKPHERSMTTTTTTMLTTSTIRSTTYVNHPRNLHRALHSTAFTASPHSIPTLVPFKERPLMFIANDGKGCWTPKSTAELKYPDPGPVVVSGDGEYPLELPYGQCDRSVQQAEQVKPGDGIRT
ncbi:hypothetical protein LTR37_006096 [Vermiconidia calcicola]|uniref:Uncharacterized protein n=1 Tax=Vermiconidia calcicola TaxID=1690605 RepID=A0ACC3NHR7_9PEZI|nr:hypothetical protein LTR37_006096 [Vermiconidia calcicola]